MEDTDMNVEESHCDESLPSQILRSIRICLVGDVSKCSKSIEAAAKVGVPVIMSDDSTEYLNDNTWKTYFVIENFAGEIFQSIHKRNHRILGPPALWYIANNNLEFPTNSRPVYNFAMKGVITCFTGIRKKDELTNLVNMIHYMGGSIRRDMNSKVTHLICNLSGGEKYQYAMTFRLSVVKPAWVYDAWSKRDNKDFKATIDDFTKNHKLKAFEGHKICFFGFAPDEYQHMVEVLQTNGGVSTDLEDPECSHVIMANSGGFFPETISPSSSPIIFDDQRLKNVTELTCESDEMHTIRSDNRDGIVLTSTNKNEFMNAQNNISPIMADTPTYILNEDEYSKDLKRKRESLDSISIISTDSVIANNRNSAKKPKLLRAGSISRTLKRSMSFVAVRTPLAGMIRERRNSVDPNSSISSITSSCDTSMKVQIKEKFRIFRNSITPKRRSPKKMTEDSTDFKTPKAPRTKPVTVIPSLPSPATGGGHESYLPCTSSYPIDISYNKQNITHQPHTLSTANECDISFCAFEDGSVNMVVDEHFTQSKPETKSNRTHIVKSDWFWYTIQNGYANEGDYLFGDYLDSIANTPLADRRDSLPISCNKRKRKLLLKKQAEGTPLGATKRRSSVSDAGLLSVSGSFLDCTASPDVSKNILDAEATPSPSPKSMRFNHFMDFYTTESNYVGILDTIKNLFKDPLEKKSDTSDSLINKSEVKNIFGNFLPIHEVHIKMLQGLKDMQMNWKEDILIGQIILDYKDDLIKAYPPYVNYFENMKDCLQQCDNQNPRFHAFLKINQAKSECGRQSLQDLMIRPVQRLPSISLLLNDILKHTKPSNADYNKLAEALNAIKEVMKYINEDKRKTEGQMAIFNIHKEIEGCPADLISSHRSFIRKCEVTELSDSLSRRGDSLVLYMFSDTIEVCKKRSSGSYKHVYLMPLSAIRLIIDISDSSRAFSLHCRHSSESRENLYSFMMCDEEMDKMVFLKTLSKQMAENACRTDTDKQLVSFTSQEIGIDLKDVNIVTKAFKLVARTRMKVERTFSFNKTPSKLKRAVSTIMTSPFGSTNSLTPSTQLAQMKLASCTNINEMSEDDDGLNDECSSSPKDMLVTPMTIQSRRKQKSSTSSTLRRI